jgi:hypothetical protein
MALSSDRYSSSISKKVWLSLSIMVIGYLASMIYNFTTRVWVPGQFLIFLTLLRINDKLKACRADPGSNMKKKVAKIPGKFVRQNTWTSV